MLKSTDIAAIKRTANGIWGGLEAGEANGL
jgi:hypothetical protein